jgi:dihydropteroate synthase
VSALQLGRRSFGPSDLVVMAVVRGDGDPASGMARVHEVVAEGADIIDVGSDPGGNEREEIGRTVPFIATVRDAYPELVIGVSTGRPGVAREACAAGADLVRPRPGGSGFALADVAAGSGAGVAGSLAVAEHAVAVAGIPAGRVVVGVPGAGLVASVAGRGWPVLVSPAPDQDLAGSLATVAVAAWLGARVFRVACVLQTRRALRMVAAIRGDVSPAYAVRGLALIALTEAVAVGPVQQGLD